VVNRSDWIASSATGLLCFGIESREIRRLRLSNRTWATGQVSHLGEVRESSGTVAHAYVPSCHFGGVGGKVRRRAKGRFLSTEDRGVIYADVYGEGDRGVVLAHGGRFNKESWEKQAQTLASAGFRVLALDFRGYGNREVQATLPL